MAVFQSTEPDPAWSFEECTTKQTAALTHGYHRYPAKFIPPLVARLIDEYTAEGDLVGDPFMGSGTTLVEAIIRGRRAVGVDVNPVSYLIARAKTTPIEPSLLKSVIQELFLKLPTGPDGRLDGALSYQAPRLEHERIDYWFTEPNRSELEAVLHLINQVEPEEVRCFLLCGFSNILKNCSRWLMKSSKPTVDRGKAIPPLAATFKKYVSQMEKRNRQFWEIMQEKKGLPVVVIQNGDARQLPVLQNSIDLIVTSPPYVTSYEYADLHQLSNIVLGFAKDLRELRKRFIGSLQAEENEEELISPLAVETINCLMEADRQEGRGAMAYFQSMQQCLREMYIKLKHGGRACIVIGNTALRKIPVLNAEIFAETGVRMGFSLERLILRKIPSKILPQTRDPKTGRFTSADKAEFLAYPEEYIVVLRK